MSDHILVITDRPCIECAGDAKCEACLEEGPEYDWSIICPGVSDACMSYIGCGECPTIGDPEARENWFEDMMEDPEAHGVEHHLCLGEWMVPTGQCWVQVCDYTCDAVSDLGGRKDGKWVRLPAGSYPVDFDVIDEEYIELTLA